MVCRYRPDGPGSSRTQPFGSPSNGSQSDTHSERVAASRHLIVGLLSEFQGARRSDDAPHRPPGIGPSFSRFDNSYIRTKGMGQWHLIRGSVSDESPPHCSVAFPVRSLRICVQHVGGAFILSVSSSTVGQRSLKKSFAGQAMDLSLSPEQLPLNQQVGGSIPSRLTILLENNYLRFKNSVI